jgi:hypothetical protein
MMIDIELRHNGPFGLYYDLYPHINGARSIIVAASKHWTGFKPYKICLPHQLMPKDLSINEETWILPVLSPWICVVGRDAGETHPRTVNG